MSRADGAGATMVEAGGITNGVSSHVLGLWIDLVRQAGHGAAPSLGPAANGLTRQELSALGFLSAEGLSTSALARSLGISTAAATALADRLTSVGAAAVRYGDSLDGPLVHLVATGPGALMASAHRRSQTATLERLLGQTGPARRAVLTVALKQLASAVTWPPCASGDEALAPGGLIATLPSRVAPSPAVRVVLEAPSESALHPPFPAADVAAGILAHSPAPSVATSWSALSDLE